MKLRDFILSRENDNVPGYYLNYDELRNEIDTMLNDFVNMQPKGFMVKYVYSNKIKDLNVRLKEELPISERFFNNSSIAINVCQLNNFNFQYYVNGVLKSFNNTKPTFNIEKYSEINKVHIALLFTKFIQETLTDLHIKYICFVDMFNQFNNYDKESEKWLIDPQFIKSQFDIICNLDVATINYYKQYYKMEPVVEHTEDNKKKETKKKKIHYTEKDIRLMFIQYNRELGYDSLHELSQTEKKEAIMKYAKCKSTTARNYMKEYNMTSEKYIRSDYREIHDHIDDATDKILRRLDEEILNTNKNITRSKNEILDKLDSFEQLLKNSGIK